MSKCSPRQFVARDTLSYARSGKKIYFSKEITFNNQDERPFGYGVFGANTRHMAVKVEKISAWYI